MSDEILRGKKGRRRGRSSPAFIHGQSNTRIFNMWKGMIQRCDYPKHISYKNYGAKGITVCERWREFANFLSDMGDPGPGLWIERIDNAKGYAPENCRWATPKEQNRHRCDNSVHTINGITGCVAELAPMFGLKEKTVTQRLLRGYPPELAFTPGRFKTGVRTRPELR